MVTLSHNHRYPRSMVITLRNSKNKNKMSSDSVILNHQILNPITTLIRTECCEKLKHTV